MDINVPIKVLMSQLSSQLMSQLVSYNDRERCGNISYCHPNGEVSYSPFGINVFFLPVILRAEPEVPFPTCYPEHAKGRRRI